MNPDLKLITYLDLLLKRNELKSLLNWGPEAVKGSFTVFVLFELAILARRVATIDNYERRGGSSEAKLHTFSPQHQTPN